MSSYDVVIIGGGVLGLSTAYWLAKQGVRTVVLEKGRVGQEASSRAQGFQSMRGENPPEIALAAEANRLWHTLDEELGYPTEWNPSGRLWVALSEHEHEEFKKSASLWQAQKLPVDLISAAEARALVPGLTDKVVGALYTRRGGHANPQRTTQAFAWAFLDRGGVILEQTPALSIEVHGAKVVGARTPGGLVSAATVVNCAGPQVALLCEPLGIHVPVVAARMEAAITTPLPKQFEVAMVGNGLSARQTRRGNILFDGGPHEWVDVDLTSEPAKPSTALLQGEARRLLELVPTLKNAAVLRTWSGIVEVTPDHATIIERTSTPEGLILATGSGHGFGLAPAIGKSISELVTSGRSSIPIEGTSLSRFRNLDPSWAQSRKWVAGEYNT